MEGAGSSKKKNLPYGSPGHGTLVTRGEIMSAGQANMPKRKMISGNQTTGMVDNYGLSDERSFINNIFE